MIVGRSVLDALRGDLPSVRVKQRSRNLVYDGDSITQGADGDEDQTNDTGWREIVFNHIVANNYTVNPPVGIRNHGAFGSVGDRYHNGVPAAQINGSRARAAQYYGPDSTWDLGLMIRLIGVNNLRQSEYQKQKTLDESLIHLLEVKSRCPHVRILDCTLSSVDPSIDQQTSDRVLEYNAEIPSQVWDRYDERHPGARILRCDMYTIVGTNYGATHNPTDGLHWLPAAYNVAGAAIVALIDPVLREMSAP